MMKLPAMAAWMILLAMPATADISIDGDPALGLGTSGPPEECVPTEAGLEECLRESSQDTHGTSLSSDDLPDGLSISGNASMGVIYDGNDFNVKHNVSVEIHFSTSIGKGTIAGSHLSLESN